MYQDFCIVSIEPIFVQSKILVNTNFDINEESLVDSEINLFSKHSATDLNISCSVSRKTLIIDIKNDIVPNSEYILRVAGIKSVLDDSLASGVRKRINFKSKYKEIPIIISPSEYEEIETISVKLKTITENNNLFDDTYYRIQLSNDNAFINLIVDTTTVNDEITLSGVFEGQYFLRVRLESFSEDKDFGRWSEITTFVVSDSNKADDDITSNPCDPEYIENIQIVSRPENGETPESIIIEFSGPINPDYLDNIVLIRREI